MNLSEIKLNPANPRTIKDEKFAFLKRSIQEFPQMMTLRPIVIDDSGVVLGGNMRLQALKALGHKTIPDEWVKRVDDLTPEQKQEFIIKDNAGFGQWDWDLLANEWSDLPLSDWGVDMPEDWAPTEPVKEDESAVAEMIDKAAELQKKWKTKTGQLWEIPSNSAQGKNHRLLVGDSTKESDVRRLCANVEPLLMVTDPPYGVEYNANWRNVWLKDGHRATGKVISDDRDDWFNAWGMFKGDVAYVWQAGHHAGAVQSSLEISGFEIRGHIVWSKSHFVIGRGHYSVRHEACWYAVRKGHKANWIGPANEQTVWEFGLDERAEGGHSTQKPVECMARPIRNHEGDVYEPFAGSGTTIVAAEQNNRACYATEISPAYVAVILERLSSLGLTPKLTNETETKSNAVQER